MAQRLQTDWILFLTITVLVCFGLVMVYSASSIIAELKFHVNNTHFFVRQLGWAVFSFLILLYAMKRDYRAWNNPKIAFAVLVEYGGSGGPSAGAIAHHVIDACVEHGYVPLDTEVHTLVK